MIKKNKDVKINGYSVLKKLFKKYENQKWVHTKDYIEKFKNKYSGRYSKYENSSVEDMVYVTKSGIGIGLKYGTYGSMFFYREDNWWDDFKIDSSIKTNNLLTLINTYQTYKINKNTKSLRG